MLIHYMKNDIVVMRILIMCMKKPGRTADMYFDMAGPKTVIYFDPRL